MNKTPVILAISILSIFAINSVFADSAKLVNPANNHTYKRFDTAKTWTQAKNACANLGGHLATVTSQTENDWIWNKFGASAPAVGVNKGFWLGGTDAAVEGQWIWITGESWNYSNWAAGEPNNYGSGQNYSVMWDSAYNNGLASSWDDEGLASDKSGIAYLCEWDKPLKNYTSMITADTNNDNISEFVLIGNNGAVNKVVSIDRQNKTVISEVDFSAYPIYSGISLSVVDDMNNNGKAEFSLLLTKKYDGSSVIETRDSGTGELLESYIVPR
jgi:hypothetical protein